MKMVKKVLFGAVALAAILSLVSCGKKNDTEKAIKGAGDNWTVEYTNDGDSNYRAYRSTGLAHAGAIVKVTFKKGDHDPKNSKMGVIFGLEEANGKSKFNIIGIAPDGTYYISSYKDVEDIQADNFGATVNAASGPSETEHVKLSTGKKVALTTDPATGDKYTYIMYRATDADDYDIAIGNMLDSEIEKFNTQTGVFTDEENLLSAFVTRGGKIESIEGSSTEALKQSQISMYAMIQPGATLIGSWNIAKKYKEAEDIE